MKELFWTNFKSNIKTFLGCLFGYLTGAGIVFYAAIRPKAGLGLLITIVISILLCGIVALCSSYKTIKQRKKYKIFFINYKDNL